MLTPAAELQYISTGKYDRVVGIDEAGRGCWAGPVSVGAFVVQIGVDPHPRVRDSKMLKAEERESIFEHLSLTSHDVRFAQVETIDQGGIGMAVTNLIQELAKSFDDGRTLVLVDGQFAADFGPNSQQIIKGDSKFYSIAAASILAKVSRDRIMIDLDSDFPEYEFAKHKGYGTKLHREALDKHGPTLHHRRSFRPIAEML